MKAVRTTLRLAAITVAAVLTVAVALGCALWVWSGVDTSLARTLDAVARWLPADQSLQTKDTQGTLRSGGHIGWLRWQQGDLIVEVSDITFAWTPRALLDRTLQIQQLDAKHLRVEDHRPAKAEPSPPPSALQLPLPVDVKFSVDTLEWVGTTTLQATGLAGHYVFDSASHSIDGGQVQIASGNYQFKGSLQANAPMAVSANVDGSVQTHLPSRKDPLPIEAHASVTGTLAGNDATLALQAQLVPQGTPNHTATTHPQQAMRASISARIQPWQAQPVAQAQAHWQALDLAALWPQAPQTRLTGDATIAPEGLGWQAAIQTDNTLSGPWDQQKLPIDKLRAQLSFANGLWGLQFLDASGAGGHIKAQGRLTTPQQQPAQWQGSASILGIHTAALDSRLGEAVVNGQLTAQQTPRGIAFDVQLDPAANKLTTRPSTEKTVSTTGGLRLKLAHAKGLWNTPTLALDSLAVQTDDATLQGRLTVQTATLATQGQLTLNLPGAQAKLNGSMANTSGQGTWALQVLDAAPAQRWLQRLPGAPAALGASTLQGQGEFSGQWQGGWQDQGQSLHITSRVRIPHMDLRSNPPTTEPPWQLRDAQADASGTVRALTLTTQGNVSNGAQTIALQASAQGGRMANGEWQARMETAQATAQPTTQAAHPSGAWTVQLSTPLTVNWKPSANGSTVTGTAGSARLTGPAPGAAVLSWQPAQWSQRVDNEKTRTQWRTQGRITDLPLAWADALGSSRMADLGLRGDLLFAGQWDATSADSLRLRASLERTSGDLQLQPDAANTGSVVAGVREARITLSSDGERVAASLRWDSARAGQAQADFSTLLQRDGDTWVWPQDAPVAGQVTARLPPLNAWSLLAPAGWRLRGTLDTNATLAGTRAAPQWSGTLAARDLSVRSVVDGIDFSEGSLRAKLIGQRLEIEEFLVHGAGGSASGGLLSMTGALWWLPSAPDGTASDAGPMSRLRMDLLATAKAWRVSARADRQVVVSGNLSAALTNQKLLLRGALVGDQALFVVPEDSAPQLSDDVVVRTPARQANPATPASSHASTRVRTELDITLDPGPNFQVRGRGIDTRLAGQLTLRSIGQGRPPSLSGTLRTVQGTYKAYGQNLDIEQGVLRFEGAYDNPTLDILAIRPNLQQRVGVQINGTVQAPVVRLYADPDLPEAEKLAWLVLGRSGAGGGAETAVLQQAALALLGGNGKSPSSALMDALGLDAVSVRSDGARNVDGTTSATVILGKRVSRDFYLAYERSLVGTLGTLSIFYDLSRRVSVRAQAGEQSAIDLIFTQPYD